MKSKDSEKKNSKQMLICPPALCDSVCVLIFSLSLHFHDFLPTMNNSMFVSMILNVQVWSNNAVNMSHIMRKPVFRVSNQVRHKMSCTVTERKLEI